MAKKPVDAGPVKPEDQPDSLKGRDPAPTMNVPLSFVLKDKRAALLAKLDTENPEYVHSFQHRKVLTSDEGAAELEGKEQEVVKGANGKPLHHRGDPVVRQKRSGVEALRKWESDLSLSQVKAVVKNKRLTRMRSPKSVEVSD